MHPVAQVSKHFLDFWDWVEQAHDRIETKMGSQLCMPFSLNEATGSEFSYQDVQNKQLVCTTGFHGQVCFQELSMHYS